MSLTTSVVRAQVIPPNTSLLAWLLVRLSPLSSVLVLLSAASIFAGACYLVATRRRPAVLAAYLVLLPLPVIISLCGLMKGMIASLTVIAATPTLDISNADIAGVLRYRCLAFSWHWSCPLQRTLYSRSACWFALYVLRPALEKPSQSRQHHANRCWVRLGPFSRLPSATSNLMRQGRKPNVDTSAIWSAPVGRSRTCARCACHRLRL